jgi:hypothetical protein
MTVPGSTPRIGQHYAAALFSTITAGYAMIFVREGGTRKDNTTKE